MVYFLTITVYFFISQDDISYNKVATQSHTWVGAGYDASNAVDGNIATCMRTKTIGSRSDDKTLWWKVDLGGVYSIYTINIQFKSYSGEGMYCYEIYMQLSDTLYLF